MYRDLRIAAILPALNESALIGDAVRMLPRGVFDDVIVVDDGSLDDTAEQARSAGADEVIRHPVNRGVGAALVTGFEASAARGNDVTVVIPGDGQADLEALPALLDRAAEGYGLVIADRLSGRDATEFGMPRYRIFGSRVLAVMTWITTGIYVADPQSGYVAVRTETVHAIPMDQLYPRWGIHNDMLSYCALFRVPVTTVRALPVYTSPAGERITSHIKLWDLIPRHAKVFSRMMMRRLAYAGARATGRMARAREWPAPPRRSRGISRAG